MTTFRDYGDSSGGTTTEERYLDYLEKIKADLKKEGKEKFAEIFCNTELKHLKHYKNKKEKTWMDHAKEATRRKLIYLRLVILETAFFE
ncbi:MAG: hypothetical protein K9M15_01920 [Candidatus Marinimicrobia bacterium]|nr:hypothetical protein [Candidatus Neomarinimicrobiota bacterium]